jgi:hypothetical protein
MAHPVVVVTNPTGSEPVRSGGVFNDLKFFLVQRLPTRSHFVRDIEANGGSVVKLERQADFVIADHMRRDAPAGSYSYTFITAALQSGELPDAADHLASTPTAVREVGSTVPRRGHREPFTAADDQFLLRWVEQGKATGASLKGNTLYKTLEAANPRHTYQAWRDRYIKHLMDRVPPPAVHETAPPAAPSTPPVVGGKRQASSVTGSGSDGGKCQTKRLKMEHENEGQTAKDDRCGEDTDFEQLLREAEYIETMPKENEKAAWTAWAETHPQRTPKKWRKYYYAKVQPAYLRSLAEDGVHPEFPTSDANDAADAQLNAEASANNSGTTAVHQHVKAAMYSRLQLENKEKGKQSLKKSIAATERSRRGANKTANHDDSTVRIPDNLERLSPVHVPQARSRPEAKPQDLVAAATVGHALTEANLAAQEALHNPPSHRATDLPEDDEHQDQTVFVEFLQDMVDPSSLRATVKPTVRRHSSGPERLEDAPSSNPAAPSLSKHSERLGRERRQHIIKDSSTGPHPDKSLSIRQERDRSRQQHCFTSQSSHSRAEDHDHTLVNYSKLQGNDGSSPLRYLEREQEPVVGATTVPKWPRSSSEHTEEEGPTDEIDLTVPLPDDGFAFGSSLSDTSLPHLPKFNAAGPADERSVSTKKQRPTGNVIELSSDSSSSTSLESSSHAGASPRSRVLDSTHSDPVWETQEILNAETQKPDLDVPLPADPDNVETQKPDLDMPLPAGPDNAAEYEVRGPSPEIASAQKGVSAERSAEPTLSEQKEAEELKAWIGTMKARGFEERSIIWALQRTSMLSDLAELVLLLQKRGMGFPQDVPGVWSEEEDDILGSGNAKGLRQVAAKHGWEESLARMNFLDEWRAAE